MSAQKQLVAGIEREGCLLATDGAACKVCPLAAILGGMRTQVLGLRAKLVGFRLVACGFRGVRCSHGRACLVSENTSQRDARARLTGQERDSFLECFPGFIKPRILLESAAEDSPGIAILRAKRDGFPQLSHCLI